MATVKKVFTSKELSEKYFRKKVDDDAESREHVCMLCYPDWTVESNMPTQCIKKAKKKSYTWATQHLELKHHGQYETQDKTGQTLFVSEDASSTYDWIHWITTENQELSFVEKTCMRKYTSGNLKPISTNTLKERMLATVEVMENNLDKKLGKKFGVMFDGRSKFGVHYLGVFAVDGDVPDCQVLLGFSVFEKEYDLCAAQHAAYLTTLLGYFNRNIDSVQYMVGDNCSVNRKLARDLDIPFIGCNSHKFNLAVSRHLGMDAKDDEGRKNYDDGQRHRRQLLQALSTLMSTLKTIKGKATLRSFTNWVAIKANETQWNGNFRMVLRFIQFKDALNNIAMEDSDIGRSVAELMPCPIDVSRIIRINSDLHKFQSVSLKLQKADGLINLFDVRVLFDRCIEDFGKHFEVHLSMDSDIISNPHFENAIVKAIELGYPSLTSSEKLSLIKLEKDNEDNEVLSNEDKDEENYNPLAYGSIALQAGRKRIRTSITLIDLKKIPITSNIVERFFSQVKLNMTVLRNSMLPSTLETLMFLKINSNLLSKFTVQKALSLIHSR